MTDFNIVREVYIVVRLLASRKTYRIMFNFSIARNAQSAGTAANTRAVVVKIGGNFSNRTVGTEKC